MMRADAPAKIILLGEHSVVYNQPAIAIPISTLRASAVTEKTSSGSGLRIIAQDLGRVFPVTAQVIDDALTAPVHFLLERLQSPMPDLDILVQSQIPVASGLGSGAAISTAVARALTNALNAELTLDELNDIVYQVEKMHHGNPSGVDNTVIVYEKPVYFVRGKSIEFLDVKGEYCFLIADTGIAAPTHISVGDVGALHKSHPERYNLIFDKMGELVHAARRSLAEMNYERLGSLMSQNHLYLQELTVSSPQLDYLVETALQAGALGAKLSGGGRGGNMIALVDKTSASNARQSLLAAGAVRVIETILR